MRLPVALHATHGAAVTIWPRIERRTSRTSPAPPAPPPPPEAPLRGQRVTILFSSNLLGEYDAHPLGGLPRRATVTARLGAEGALVSILASALAALALDWLPTLSEIR